MSDHAHDFMPLARRMRPSRLSEYIGQKHLLAPKKPLYEAISHGKLHSMILWGPPGVGKTALAEIIADSADARVERISAVLAGVKDIRDVVARAKKAQDQNQSTVLFVDEVHRFNKAQQDAFLPHVEQGTLTLIGATTENPSFHLNNALLSRARVYVLKPLYSDDLLQVIDRALTDKVRGYGRQSIEYPVELRRQLVDYADGDARFCLNLLEILVDFAQEESGGLVISALMQQEVLTQNSRRFDLHGDLFYEQISALHKSVRGSDPDAALYWFARMIDGGCDPNYIARRIVRMASEDIGNADPRALTIALEAWEAFERLGAPEGELALAQAVIFLACCAKSNATYVAFNDVMADIKKQGTLPVPRHLRNAPTKLMKDLGYGKAYRYAHDEPDAFAAGETYFPETMTPEQYYQPVNRGLEQKISEKLAYLRAKNQS